MTCRTGVALAAASREHGGVPMQGRKAPGGTSGGRAGARSDLRHRGRRPMTPGTRVRAVATVLVVSLAATLAALTLAGCFEKDLPPTPTSQINIAKDAAMKTEILSIQTGIQAYIASNGQLPSTADQNTLGTFVQPWPDNPYTKVPMQPGTNPGEYTYTPGIGTSFQLVAHL